MAQFVVHDTQIEVHLAGVLGFELAGLEINDDKTAQGQVIEQQVDVEILLANRDVVLPANEGEAFP
jgi:hypothetical protein